MQTSHSLAAALLFSAILIAPDIAAAAGEANPAPPSQTYQPTTHMNQPMTHTKKSAKKKKTSSAEDFLAGYHAAYALIYDHGDYVGGIAALRALGYDTTPMWQRSSAMPAARSDATTTPNPGTSGRSPPIRTMR